MYCPFYAMKVNTSMSVLIFLSSVLVSSALTRNADQATLFDQVTRSIQFSLPRQAEMNNTLVEWGLTIPDGIPGEECDEGDECVDYGVAKVVVYYDEECEAIHWRSTELSELKDCVNVLGSHWYGGGSQFNEPWPLEKAPNDERPFVTSDYIGMPGYYGGVAESYWISSLGVAVRVEDTVPLFFGFPDNDDDGIADQLCFAARFDSPFAQQEVGATLNLTYNLCYAEDIVQVYQATYPRYLSYPEEAPDERVMTYPIWSTWAEYYRNISQELVIELAQAIIDNGFNNSQIEIDDNWETCYGNAEFDPEAFPNPTEMVDTLHNMGFRVTLWVHPFINHNCDSFAIADENKYFITDENGETQHTSWWNGLAAGLIDFTNVDAADWWTSRLEAIRTEIGIDSFKFDAGETSWIPDSYILHLDKAYWPNGYSTSYIEEVSRFGQMIETRVGHGSQAQGIYVRMLDKDSNWTQENGLLTIIPSLLHEGLLGYYYVLPDMVGGNAYSGRPDPELFARWVQANIFMPTIQFSLLPWDYDENSEVTQISLDATKLHAEYAPLIISLAQAAAAGQGPMMRPTWWLCPEEEDCLTADQQFLLGDNILVTPVTESGATKLEVVFPPGNWSTPDGLFTYEGPCKETMMNITLQSVIYFIRNM